MATRLNRNAILKYVGKCQRENGSFAPQYHESIGPFGDQDPRYTYLACSIVRVLNGDSSKCVNVKRAADFISSLTNYDGGLGDRPGSESHAGLIYCGIAGLANLGALDFVDWNQTYKYLACRQIGETHIGTGHWSSNDIGAFNGRPNKPADSCYTFWTCASLSILDRLDFVDSKAAVRFLLTECQASITGGFLKARDLLADPLHSYLGLASLAMFNPPELGLVSLCPALCLPKLTVSHFDKLVWTSNDLDEHAADCI
jgi:geranylgeranyl transferase type-1 subunit beta